MHRAAQLVSQFTAADSQGSSIQATVQATVEGLNTTFRSGKTRSLAWREQQLKNILRMVSENEDAIAKAVYQDLRKNHTEAFLVEVNMVKQEALLHLRNLKTWTQPQTVNTPLVQVKGLSSSQIQATPLGTILIISPWNYPFQLCVVPVIGAISAGCTMLVKPSEISPHTSALIATLFKKYLDPAAIAVVEGGPEVGNACLRHKYGKIFFTGSTTLGKIIYKAAAETLTPVVLELGGKSPCVVDKDVDLDVCVKRVVVGRFMNAGQTCVAPDYVLVHESIHDKFVAACKTQITSFYGANPQQSEDYGRVVNGRHLSRISGLLKDLNPEAKVEVGGLEKVDAKDNYMPPTLVTQVSPNTPLMQEEIFGPVLPILKVKNLEEAISFIGARPAPLAAYVFSKNSDVVSKFRDNVLAGGMCANDTVMHLAVPELPFGGVGDSGVGAYHGKATFDAFSHFKSFLNKTTWFDADIRYPPFTDSKKAMLKRLM
jgi:aldehyde dehydrogenase (NAD+)